MSSYEQHDALPTHNKGACLHAYTTSSLHVCLALCLLHDNGYTVLSWRVMHDKNYAKLVGRSGR